MSFTTDPPLRDQHGRFETAHERELRYQIATLEDAADAANQRAHDAWLTLTVLAVSLVLVGGAAWAFFGHENGVGPAAFLIGLAFLLFGPHEHDKEQG